MMERIRKILDNAALQGTGLLGVGFRDLITGEEIYLNGDTVFPTASVFKVFVLCELFRREQEGTFSFSDCHILQEHEKSIGSGVLESAEAGTRFSMMDYAMLMMRISDNTASDYLFSLAGPENIRKYILEPQELTHTKIDLNCAQLLTNYYGVTMEEYRRVLKEEGRWYYRNAPHFRCEVEKNNQTSPQDMVKLLSKMYAGTLLGSDSDRRMLDIMLQCETNARIPAKLPEGTPVAHKTGSIDHLANDCGIVYTDKGDYVLTLFYNGNLASKEEYEGTDWSTVGNSILSQLSADIYYAYTQGK